MHRIVNRIGTKNLLIGGAVLAVVLYVAARGWRGAAASAANAAVNVAGGVVEGTVTGVGQMIGIPATDAEKCEAAIARGDTWEASFYCPAGTFIGSLFN